MFIQNNANALNIWRNWQTHGNAVAKSIQRLSSGMRINSAADDAAGLGITERMKSKLRMIGMEQLSTENRLSYYQMEDAMLGQVQLMLNRMQELSAQSMNGTYTEGDRKALNTEYQQLADEINRTVPELGGSATTLFNENGSSLNNENDIVFKTNDISNYLESLDGFLDEINVAVKNKDYDMAKNLGIDLTDDLSNKDRIRLAVTKFTTENAEKLFGAENEDGLISVTVSGDNVSIKMDKIDNSKLGLEGTHLLDAESAGIANEAIKKAIDTVSELRGSMGAMMNSMERMINRLADMEINLTDSMSRILDADMAKEMMNLVKGQMMMQVNSFLMATANQDSEMVLELLKD